MLKETLEIEMMYKNRGQAESNEETLLLNAQQKLVKILNEAKDRKSLKNIHSYLASNPTNEKKLLSFCEEFVDPTLGAQTFCCYKADRLFCLADDSTNEEKSLSFCEKSVDLTLPAKTEQNSEIVCRHTFLKQDELNELEQFVERHKRDMSFGAMVYSIMDAHEMNAPQVYKNALMKRQDFSRVTDPRCKNVTRKMAWQIIIGLHCSLQEADVVLFSAGYVRRNTRFDLTMQYFIEHERYDIEAIDAVLSEFDLRTFTCE